MKVELAKIPDLLTRLESQALSVHPLQCVQSRHQKAECTLCAENCPTGAITWDNPELINAGTCTGCGTCAAVCPTGVFEALGPTDADLQLWIEKLAETTLTIAFACPRTTEKDSPGLIRIPCVGRIDTSVLIGAAAAGIQSIELVDGECASCPFNSGHSAAELTCAEANTILQALESSSSVALVSESSLPDMPAPKVKLAPGDEDPQGYNSAHQSESLIKKGELPVRIPAKRQLLQTSLAHLEKPVSTVEVRSKLWASIKIEDSCTGCQMCAFFCPTGALQKFEENGMPGLAYTLANCVNCRLCLEICYTTSIELESRVEISRVISQASEVVWSNKQTSSHEEKMKRLRMFK